MPSSLKDICAKYYIQDGTVKPAYYLDIYEKFLSPIKDEPISVLELGVFSGASIMAWREYFPNAKIVGLDIRPMPPMIKDAVASGAISFIHGSQSDGKTLDACMEAVGGKFDVIIDDASHIGVFSRASFEYLFRYGLKNGGLYFVEDYGTGYFDGDVYQHQSYRSDDKQFQSHTHGMVGWIKQLIDVMHVPYMAGVDQAPAMGIETIQFWPSIALVKKG